MEMPPQNRDLVRARLAELQHTLQRTKSEDLRDTLRLAIDECEQRLAQLDAEAEAERPAPAQA